MGPRWASLSDMQIWLADSLLGGPGQGTRQIVELLAAFGLTSLIGLERTIQGKSAGLRTQTIVGTSAALILLISKYGFGDVLKSGAVELEASRIAAQIVSGIGFLGAGIIITRRGAVHGLTTAAAWESAAIGMAAGAGLVGLAVVVVVLHFISAFAYSTVERQLTGRLHGTVRLHIIYDGGQGAAGAAAALRTQEVAHLRTRFGAARRRARSGRGDDDLVRRQDHGRNRRARRSLRGCRGAAGRQRAGIGPRLRLARCAMVAARRAIGSHDTGRAQRGEHRE
jgi:putative Mg2+ transporter-C (MgtC) family protein